MANGLKRSIMCVRVAVALATILALHGLADAIGSSTKVIATQRRYWKQNVSRKCFRNDITTILT